MLPGRRRLARTKTSVKTPDQIFALLLPVAIPSSSARCESIALLLDRPLRLRAPTMGVERLVSVSDHAASPTVRKTTVSCKASQ